jgi:hypothetical protein
MASTIIKAMRRREASNFDPCWSSCPHCGAQPLYECAGDGEYHYILIHKVRFKAAAARESMLIKEYDRRRPYNG